MNRLYIAGGMSGYPQHNFPSFFAAAEQLRAAGFEVENPADNDGPTLEEAVRNAETRSLGDWATYMRMDIPRLLVCDGVAVLPNWSASRGAALEVQIAEALGMVIHPIVVWLIDYDQKMGMWRDV